MFEEGKDFWASDGLFLQMFRYQDERVKRELMYIFVKGFKRRYDEIKIKTKRKEGIVLLTLLGYLGEVKGFQHADPTEQSKRLGECLGTFLGMAEYWIPTQLSTSVYHNEEDMIAHQSQEIANELKSANKK